MRLDILQEPEQELIEFLDARIAEFNWAHWEVSERHPIAVQITEHGEVVGGAAGRTFGNWLHLNTLWVSEQLRGQHTGTRMLEAIEHASKARGCRFCLVDTLNFQAMPFYKKHGYKTQWTQHEYPQTGCRYFMVKHL